MNTALAIVARDAYFQGHFPGRPVLPGVVQLMLVLEALVREGQQPAALQKITFVRLREIVLPGEQLDLVSRQMEHGRTRFDLTRKGRIVTNGELVFGNVAGARHGRKLVPAARAAALPSLDELLPHRAPMRLVTSIVGESADGLDCAACVPADCALVHEGRASILAGVEAAAQAAAVWEAVRRSREAKNAGPRIGYLVAMRDVELSAQDIPAQRPFCVGVRLEAAAPPLTHYRFSVSLDGSALAQGLFATYLVE